MSMPTFPTEMNTPSTREALNQIISSIAMEELGIAHIINAEGEKLQYVLGTLETGAAAQEPTIDDVLKVNESVQKMLETVSYNQMFLKAKLSDALSALDALPSEEPETTP